MSGNTNIWVGTSGWSYADWAGEFYPSNCAKAKWFDYYVTQFNTIEINATFYRYFSDKVYHNWYSKAPENFKFVIKLPQAITHYKHLINIDADIHKAENSAFLLKEKLGLLLLQLPPNLPYQPNLLRKTLATFTYPSQVVIEFRNPRWCTAEVKNLLSEFNVIYSNVDSPIIKISDTLTAKVAYLRLHGKDKMYNYDYTATELEKISSDIKLLITQGAQEVYTLFNNTCFSYAPKNAKFLKNLLCL